MADQTWPRILAALLAGETLPPEDAGWAMAEIMAGDATPVQVAAFVVALRAKGETASEVRALVDVMLGNAARVDLSDDSVDVVGTGGDRAHTVNISTMASIVVAGAGVRVVKHGNRASSSACGAADLLEALGLPLELGPAAVAHCADAAGIGFCFAPRFHPGMRHAGVPRREMGIPTVFNFLGPLTNPAQPRAYALGCADHRMAAVMAEVLAGRGNSALVMRGEDGLDELTTTSPTQTWVVHGGQVRKTVIDAADFGMARVTKEALRGADATYNADVARRVLAGEPGSVRDAVLMNAAAALAAYDGLGGDLHTAIAGGLARATEAVDSGAAAETLRRWVDVAVSAKQAEQST